jgi:hypothetical protein
LIKRLSEDPASLFYENHTVLDQAQLIEHCPLSTKSEFWVELEAQNVLYDPVVCVAINDWSVISPELTELLKNQNAYIDKNNDEARTLLRYSSEVELGALYKLEEVQEAIKDKPSLITELNKHVDNEAIKLDKFSRILIVPEDLTYFSDFDGVTLDDLKEFFDLDDQSAAWIMNILEETGVLKLQIVQMTRFTTNNQIWTNNNMELLESKLLIENAGILQAIKDNRKILNVTKEVIGQFCRIPDGPEKEQTLDKFYTYLQKKVLETFCYNIWRLNSKLDCSSLPPCIAGPIDEFLADRFAYTFALEEICLSLEKAFQHPLPTPSQVFLPENPFREFYEDLINFGLAIPPRILVTSETIDDIDFEDYEFAETIKSVIHSNRLKLYDQTYYHMGLVSFSTYVRDQGFLVDSDLNNIINNGLKVVVARKNETSGSWLINKIIGFASGVWNQIKKVANSITSFCYSAVQFVCQLPSNTYNPFSVLPYFLPFDILTLT